MRKIICFFMCFVMVLAIGMVVGCTTNSIEEENEEPKMTEQNEYALYIRNEEFAVSEELVADIPWEEGEVTEQMAELPFPASRHYIKDNLKISSFLIDDEQESGEEIVSIVTTEEGTTPRDIGIGDGLDAMKKAYPELTYHNGACGTDMELVEFTRMYSYEPEDGSNNYINFYLKDKKISMIEIANSLDAPRNWYVPEPILGQDNLFCEILSDKPGESHVQYFLVKDNGEEEVLLDIKNAWPQSIDLDDDGKTEIIVQYTENNQYNNVGIYYWNEAQLEYIDVNKELADEEFEHRRSYYSEVASNEQSQYQYSIQCIEERLDGRKQKEKYVFEEGKLICIE